MADTNQLIQEFLDLQIPRELSISKNGQSVVYAAGLPWKGLQKKGEHPVSSIWHAESGKANSAKQLTSGLHFDRLPKISPDGKIIAFISDRAKQGSSCAVYILSLAGGEPYPITPADNERSITQIKWSPDGKSIAYLSADEKTSEQKKKDENKDDAIVHGEHYANNRLRIVHLATRDSKTIVNFNKHISDFDWHSSGDSLAFYTQRNSDIESAFFLEAGIHTISILGNEQPVLHAEWPAYVASLAYGSDGVYFNAFVSQTAVGSLALYKLDIESNEYKRVAHGDHDCSPAVKRIDQDIMCFVQNGLDSSLEVDGKTIIKIPNEIEYWDAAYPNDSDELIVAIIKSDINNSSEVYTKTASGGAFVKLSSHSTTKEIAKTKFISCKTSDGTTTIEGVLHTPIEHASEDTPKKPLSTVVSIHGGPYSRNTNQHNPSYFFFANLVLAAGYAVLLVNYRGSSGRGEAFAGKARGGIGIYDEPDIIALTQHCIEQDWINKEEIVVSGWSQGGCISYLCSVRNGMHDFGWKFKGAIPGAGVTDWDTMCFTSDVAVAESEMAGFGPWGADKSDISNRSGSAIWELKEAAEHKAVPPMLILHGEKDVRVPLEQAAGFRRGLEHYNLPFEMVVYPREGHVISERKHLEDMLRRFARFCDQHLTKN